MSNIRQRGDKWQVRVTVDGVTATKSFTRRADALKWSQHQQVLMERGDYQKAASLTTLSEAINRYIVEVLPTRRGASQEKYILAYWRTSVLGSRPLASIIECQAFFKRLERAQLVAEYDVQ